MEYMHDFLNEIILDPKYRFIDDLFDVIENHPELINYTFIFLNENITNY